MLTCYCGKINSLLVDGLDGNSWFIFRGRFLTFLWHKYVHSMYYLMGKYRYNNGELSTHYRAIVEHAWVFQRHSLYNELTIPDQSKWWWLLMIQVHPAKQFEQWNFWVLGSHVPRVHQWTWGNMPSQHLQVQSTCASTGLISTWDQWGESFPGGGLAQASELQNAHPSEAGGNDWFGHWFCISGNQTIQCYWLLVLETEKGYQYQVWLHIELILCSYILLNYECSFWALLIRTLSSASYNVSSVTI